MSLSLTLPTITLAHFPGGYQQAQRFWQTSVGTLNLPVKTCHYPLDSLLGPQGERLATEALWLGEPEAPSVLVVISATHGVEGFAGSAVQLDFLQRLTAGLELPKGVGVLLVHALNAWGYAWLRRCDSEGIDLNRNFIDFTEAPPENPGYDALQPMLSATAEVRENAFLHYRQQYGQTAFERAISGGQYTDSGGPFYGGRAKAHGHRVIDALLSDFSLPGRRLCVIDIHTGLGPYGYGELICDHPLGSRGVEVATHWFGASVTLPAAGTSSSVPKWGLLDYAWHPYMTAGGCFLTLEFGSFGTPALFDVILENHRIWREQGADAFDSTSSLAMQKHFAPPDANWRELVLVRARQVLGQALSQLAQPRV